LLRLITFTTLLFTNIFWIAIAQGEQKKIEFFYKDGCSHCTKAKKFLSNLQSNHKDVVVEHKNIIKDKKAKDELVQLAIDRDYKRIGVPVFYINGEMIVGFDTWKTTGMEIKKSLGLPHSLGKPAKEKIQKSPETCNADSQEATCDSSAVETASTPTPWWQPIVGGVILVTFLVAGFWAYRKRYSNPDHRW